MSRPARERLGDIAVAREAIASYVARDDAGDDINTWAVDAEQLAAAHPEFD